jgi:glutamate-1-semialdehyde aminotransferase
MQLLDEHVFFASTFGGEVLSLAAARITINELYEKDVPAYLARQGEKLKTGYNRIAQDLGIDSYTHCKGHPCRTLIVFDSSVGDPLLTKSLVQQEMIKRGILWMGFHNMCYTHTDEDIAYTLDVYREVLAILRQAVGENAVTDYLRGEPVQPVFRKTGGFNIKPKPQTPKIEPEMVIVQ